MIRSSIRKPGEKVRCVRDARSDRDVQIVSADARTHASPGRDSRSAQEAKAEPNPLKPVAAHALVREVLLTIAGCVIRAAVPK